MSAESALEAAPPVAASAPTIEGPMVAEAATAIEIEQERSIEIAGTGPQAEASEPSTLTPALSQGEREAAAAQIRESQSLPPALRDCLARVALAHAEAAPDGSIHVPIDVAVRAMEEALPDFLRSSRGELSRREHPAGEAFFRGDPAELSDADAEEIARGQLARSGLLRGQKVRTAE